MPASRWAFSAECTQQGLTKASDDNIRTDGRNRVLTRQDGLLAGADDGHRQARDTSGQLEGLGKHVLLREDLVDEAEALELAAGGGITRQDELHGLE